MHTHLIHTHRGAYVGYNTCTCSTSLYLPGSSSPAAAVASHMTTSTGSDCRESIMVNESSLVVIGKVIGYTANPCTANQRRSNVIHSSRVVLHVVCTGMESDTKVGHDAAAGADGNIHDPGCSGSVLPGSGLPVSLYIILVHLL